MDLLIFILGGKVERDRISDRFRIRLDKAIDVYKKSNQRDKIFLVAGRTGNINSNSYKSEAQVGMEYIQQRIPEADVIKEEVSVDMIGNFAFMKGIIMQIGPKKVVGVVPLVSKGRTDFLDKKVFGDDLEVEYYYTRDELLEDEGLVEKEESALKLVENLLKEVEDGDAANVRDILLYKTPYYFKNVVDDKEYFDKYWEGGFKKFLEQRKQRASKG